MPPTIFTRRRFLAGAVAAALALPAAAAAAGLRAGDRPAPIALLDLAGARVALPEAYRGKVVAVHFWASWCPYCIKEIEALAALVGQLKDRGFAPVSVNVGETKAVVNEFFRTRSVPYPILLDPDSATAKLYGVTGIPTTFLLDRTGAVGFKVLGEINREGLRRILSGML